MGESVLEKLAKPQGLRLGGANHAARVMLRMERVSVALGVVDAALAEIPLARTNGEGFAGWATLHCRRCGRLGDKTCSADPADIPMAARAKPGQTILFRARDARDVLGTAAGDMIRRRTITNSCMLPSNACVHLLAEMPPGRRQVLLVVVTPRLRPQSRILSRMNLAEFIPLLDQSTSSGAPPPPRRRAKRVCCQGGGAQEECACERARGSGTRKPTHIAPCRLAPSDKPKAAAGLKIDRSAAWSASTTMSVALALHPDEKSSLEPAGHTGALARVLTT